MIKIDIILKIAKKLKMMEHQERVPEKLKSLPGIIAFHGMGSGKTLTAVNSANKLGIPAIAVVPASLRGNFKKELDKFYEHTGEKPDIKIMSYEEFSKMPPDMKDKMLILDEAHKYISGYPKRSMIWLALYTCRAPGGDFQAARAGDCQHRFAGRGDWPRAR